MLGKRFKVRTDHHALQWLRSFKEPQGQVARWLEKLQEYDFEIIHRPGKEHINADAMSRRPRRHHGGHCPSCGDMEQTAAAAVSRVVQTKSDSSVSDEASWSADNVKEAQQGDPDIAYAIKLLSEAKDKPSKRDLQGASPMVKSICAKWSLLELNDGVLYINPTDNKKNWKARIVLPLSLLTPALKRVHDGMEGSNLGTFKTLHKLQARFWRPGLSSAVYDYVQSCVICGKRKPPPTKPKAGLISIPSSHPMQRVHIDIIGPVPRTKKGNCYILTVQCAYTKWAEAYPFEESKS